MQEFNQAWTQLGHAAPQLAFLPTATVIQAAKSAGLELQVQQRTYQVFFPDVLTLSREFKQIGANYTQQMAQTYQKVSQETGAELNNQFLKGIADDPDPLRWFQPDRIHPNEGAQSLMVKNIWPQMKKMLASQK